MNRKQRIAAHHRRGDHMTQPEPEPAPQPAPDPGGIPPNIQIAGSIVPGPNGDILCGLIVQYGFTSFTIVVTPDTADQLADALPGILREGASRARRMKTGLILPSDMPQQAMPLPPHAANGTGRRPRG
jgi:hypothetical protein